jgi:hypothetical protein
MTYLIVAYPFLVLGMTLLVNHFVGSLPRSFVLGVGAFFVLATITNVFVVRWLRRETRRGSGSMAKRFPLAQERAEARLERWLAGEEHTFSWFWQRWTVQSPGGGVEVWVRPHATGWTRVRVAPLDEGTDITGVLEAIDGAMARG